MDLSEFLLARIAEDEEWARLSAGPDYSDGEPGTPGHSARVLAECESKRRIVELHREETKQQWVHEMDGPDRQETEYSCVICGWFPPGSACDTLRLLALPYADHPDYDPAWRP